MVPQFCLQMQLILVESFGVPQQMAFQGVFVQVPLGLELSRFGLVSYVQE